MHYQEKTETRPFLALFSARLSDAVPCHFQEKMSFNIKVVNLKITSIKNFFLVHDMLHSCSRIVPG